MAKSKDPLEIFALISGLFIITLLAASCVLFFIGWQKRAAPQVERVQEASLSNMKGTRCQPCGSDQHVGDNGIE